MKKIKEEIIIIFIPLMIWLYAVGMAELLWLLYKGIDRWPEALLGFIIAGLLIPAMMFLFGLPVNLIMNLVNEGVFEDEPKE